MKAPTRFKHAPSSGIAGHLMVAGGTESPSSDALERTAQRLGLPAGLLATAAITTATTSATAASAAGASTTAGGAVALFTAVKAAALGIGLGVSLAVGAHFVQSSHGDSSRSAESSTTVKPSPRQPLKAAAVTPAPAVSASSAPQIAEPEPVLASDRAASTLTAASRTTATVANGRGREPAAIDVTPIEPLQPTLAPPPAIPGLENASQGPAGAHAATANTHQPLSDPRLAREIASLDRARTLANRGAPAAALRELDDFGRSYGYVAMRREALLVRLDVLLALGQRVSAAQVARELLALGVPAAQQSRLRDLAGSTTVNSPRP